MPKKALCKKDINNNWLAPSDNELRPEEKKEEKSTKKTLVWVVIKELIRTGYYICKIIEFFENFFNKD